MTQKQLPALNALMSICDVSFSTEPCEAAIRSHSQRLEMCAEGHSKSARTLPEMKQTLCIYIYIYNLCIYLNIDSGYW